MEHRYCTDPLDPIAPEEHRSGRISNRRTHRFYSRESLKRQREIMTRTKGNHDNDIGALMHARREVVTRRTNGRTSNAGSRVIDEDTVPLIGSLFGAVCGGWMAVEMAIAIAPGYARYVAGAAWLALQRSESSQASRSFLS